MKLLEITASFAALLAFTKALPTPENLNDSNNNTIIDSNEYLIFGTKDQYVNSTPFYPSPLGGRIEGTWQEAYEKARKIVDILDITEKVNITTGIGMLWGQCSGNTGSVNGEGLGFREGFCANDGPLGVRGTDLVTGYPAELTIASTFNKNLIFDRGDAIGREFKAKGIDIFLGPVAGPIGYKALGGRGWEGFGPDPYLQGEAIRLTVEAIQKNKVIAVSKHFIGNEQEHHRNEIATLDDGYKLEYSISSNIDDRAMHEVFMWPFAEAVKAGTGSVMCSYNKINGSHGCSNSYTLNNLLKTELGFQGFVMSDWYGVHSGVASTLAGLDMNMPGDNKIGDGSYHGANLTQSILNGTVSQDRLDDMVTRILASYYFVGANHTKPNFSANTKKTYTSEFVNPKTGKEFGQKIMVNQHVDVRTDFSDEVAMQGALEGIILLKNKNNALPLNSSELKSIAILGQAAVVAPDGFYCNDFVDCYGGAPPSGFGSGASSASKFISPAEGVSEKCRKENIQYDIVSDSWNFESAMAKAEIADALIVFVASHSGEAVATVDKNYGDRNNASLWYNADELIKNVTNYNNNTIIAITTPGAVNIESFVENDNVTAILMSSYLGQEAGSSITKVLFGDYNPSGRIPFTIAKDDQDYVPIIYNITNYEPQDYFTDSIFLDYRRFDYYNITPRYEFGFGLSYSNFTFSNLSIESINVPSRDLSPASPYLETYSFKENEKNPELYTFPEGFDRLEGYIYPYIDSTNINNTISYPYPEGYSTEQLIQPPLAAGGLGGNPELWDIAYHVEADLKNNGPYNGSYVAQLYIGIPSSAQFPSPPHQLRGFDKLSLNVGESGKVSFDITRKDLSVWDVVSQTWIVQSGTYNIYVGSSSRNLELVQTIEIP